MTLGPEAVSNAELLAILIGSGTPDVTSVDLMRKVLSEHGDSLRALGTLSFIKIIYKEYLLYLYSKGLLNGFLVFILLLNITILI